MAVFNKPNVNIEWSQAGSNIDPTDPKYIAGWDAGEVPAAQNVNYLWNRDGSFQRHVNESGIARWDGITSYSIGSYVSYEVTAGDIRLYQSKIDANVNQNPVTVTAAWEDLTGGQLSHSYGVSTGPNARSP